MSTRRMPALSIRQPWAWLIVNGHKDVENRDWQTPFRGRVLVHAGLTFPRSYYEEQRDAMARARMLPGGFPSYEELRARCGGIVGEVTITDCLTPGQRPFEGASPWWLEGAHAFTLADPVVHRFWPMKGRLGFFDVEVAAA